MKRTIEDLIRTAMERTWTPYIAMPQTEICRDAEWSTISKRRCRASGGSIISGVLSYMLREQDYILCGGGHLRRKNVERMGAEAYSPWSKFMAQSCEGSSGHAQQYHGMTGVKLV
jgi:hypothetical protein